MIRWTYLLPRLLVVGVLLATICWGLNPLAHWAIVNYAPLATGAKVDIETVDVSLMHPTLRIQGLQVADPGAAYRNLFEAAQIVCTLDRDALLRRRLVVREGRITGLRLHTERQTAGTLPAQERDTSEFGADLTAFGEGWLADITQRLRADWENELATVRLYHGLSQRWPDEYRRLEAEAKALRARIDQLRQRIADLKGDNLLRQPDAAQRLVQELAEARQQVQRLPGEVQRLKEMVAEDRTAALQAKQHDLEYLKRQLKLDALDPDGLTRYLLGEEQSQRIAETVAWLQWARQHVPVKRKLPEPPRGRGRTVLLAGLRRTPAWLFENLTLEGEATWQGQPVPFQGQLRGLTGQPGLYGQPATLSLRTAGPVPLLLDATFDRTTERAHDRLYLECPAIAMPPRELGRAQRFTVKVGPATAHAKLAVTLDQDDLQGLLTWRQERVQLQAALPAAERVAALVTRLNQSLDRVDRLEVAIDLSGSLRKPRWHLRSDLGPQLAAGLTEAVQDELHSRVQQLTARVEDYAGKQLAQLQDQLAAQQGQITAILDEARGELAKAAQSFSAPAGLAGQAAEKAGLPTDLRRWAERPLGGPLKR